MGNANLDKVSLEMAKEICEDENRTVCNLVQTLVRKYYKKFKGIEK
jgi:hypothetical protein